MEVARELKKKLIEQNKLEIPQQEVESTLFNLIVQFSILKNFYEKKKIAYA